MVILVLLCFGLLLIIDRVCLLISSALEKDSYEYDCQHLWTDYGQFPLEVSSE